MEISVTDISEVEKSLQCTLGADWLNEQAERIAAEYQPHAEAPGFRKGKVPVSVVKIKYAKPILGRLNELAVDMAVEKIQKDHNLKVYQVSRAPEHEKELIEQLDAPATLHLKVDLYPSFELPAYTGLTLQLPALEPIDEAKVQKALEQLRRAHATFEPVDRPAALGDVVKFSYQATFEGQPAQAVESLSLDALHTHQANTWDELTADVPEASQGELFFLSQALHGAKAGQAQQIEHTFGPEYTVETLRGKTLVYTLEVHEVNAVRLPDPQDAEWLKTLQVESLEQLRQRLQKQLEEEQKRQDHARKREKMVEHFDKQLSFSLPPSAPRMHFMPLLQDFLRHHQNLNTAPDWIQKHQGNIVTSAQEAANLRAKMLFVFERIAQQENLAITQQDWQQALMSECFLHDINPKKLVQEIEENPARRQLMGTKILFDKVLDWLVDKAQIEYTPAA
jgi:trigger factor